MGDLPPLEGVEMQVAKELLTATGERRQVLAEEFANLYPEVVGGFRGDDLKQPFAGKRSWFRR